MMTPTIEDLKQAHSNHCHYLFSLGFTWRMIRHQGLDDPLMNESLRDDLIATSLENMNGKNGKNVKGESHARQ